MAVGADFVAAAVAAGTVTVGEEAGAAGVAADPQATIKSNGMNNEKEKADAGTLGRDILDLNLICLTCAPIVWFTPGKDGPLLRAQWLDDKRHLVIRCSVSIA
jgi:hypothetical protein